MQFCQFVKKSFTRSFPEDWGALVSFIEETVHYTHSPLPKWWGPLPTWNVRSSILKDKTDVLEGEGGGGSFILCPLPSPPQSCDFQVPPKVRNGSTLPSAKLGTISRIEEYCNIKSTHNILYISFV